MGPGDGRRLLRERTSPLFVEAAKGDPAALSTLFGAARSVVHEWVSGRTQDLDDAEDVTQMVLVKLYTRLPAFRGESRLSSWLYRITVNEVSYFYKKRARERTISSIWSEEDLHSFSPTPELDRIADAQVAGAIRDVARDLPPFQHTVFEMVDLNGMRPCEAAEELGTTQVNIRSSLCRARKKIRELVCEAQRELVAGPP